MTHYQPGALSAPEAIRALQVLSENHGFSEPIAWLEHPEVKSFARVKAKGIEACPECGGASRGTLGQYVYYSTLIRLQRCASCDLVWSDAAIDPEVLRAHFESAYKDEQYFEQGRGPVFDQLARLAARCTRTGGTVLDYGGGMGHLLDRLRQLRPDIQPTVLDISYRSVEYAVNHFALNGTCGTLVDLDGQHFDTVICSDVIYYEQDLPACWAALNKLTDTLIIRVPDKLSAIAARQRVREVLRGRRAQRLQDSIAGFNPEHRYIFSRDYLRRRLASLGYRVRIMPAVTLVPPGVTGSAVRVGATIARALHYSPAMVVIAER